MRATPHHLTFGLARLAFVLGVCLAGLGCYDEPRPACGFRCGAGGECPTGYTCGAEDRCRLDGTPDSAPCATPADAAADPDTVEIDGPPEQHVLPIGCPSQPDATVTAAGGGYEPPVAFVPPSGIVHFLLGPDHDVTPAPGSDPGLRVELGETRCLWFMQPGIYDYACSAHGHTGQIVVQ